MFVNKLFGISILFLLYSCEKPSFIKKVDPPILISKSYTVQEFVRNQADIIWVIDNSGSMREYQEAIIANMERFIDAFVKNAKGAQWRMGLLSTSKGDRPYVGFMRNDLLNSFDPDPVARFNRAVSLLGTDGDATEEAFYPIQRALHTYHDFVRETSKLFIVLVSDELEQGDQSVTDFINFLYTLKDADSIATYGVFEMSEIGCGDEEFTGSRYAEFVARTNGLTFPICSNDYGEGLAKFGADIAYKTSVSKIQLEAAPVASTIEVTYQGKQLPKGRAENGGFWNYSVFDNAIFFHNLEFLEGFDLEKVRVTFEKARLLEE